MLILADENIPEVQRYFSRFGEVRTLEGHAIDRSSVAAADVLLVRSVTRVDAPLVEGSRVRFVGSATIGTDHVDEEALRLRGIAFAHAPGSNAESVAEYVTAALLEWTAEKGLDLRRIVLGVVGYGSIGRLVVQRARALGMSVRVNDPPLAQAGFTPENGDDFWSLDRLLGDADVVTLHVPLTTMGVYRTHGLLEAPELGKLREGAAIINTSRGSVVSGEDLLLTLRQRPDLSAILDVFENEPLPDPGLIDRLFIATPHIAGYSYDGKLNGTVMLYQALCRALGTGVSPPATSDDPKIDLEPPITADFGIALRSVVRQMYDVRSDDHRMRDLLALPPGDRSARFNFLRKTYPRRRSFHHYQIDAGSLPDGLQNAVKFGLNVRVLGGGP